ncbi:hypothetical protein ACLOJK_011651 [Asimina triloba]
MAPQVTRPYAAANVTFNGLDCPITLGFALSWICVAHECTVGMSIRGAIRPAVRMVAGGDRKRSPPFYYCCPSFGTVVAAAPAACVCTSLAASSLQSNLIC